MSILNIEIKAVMPNPTKARAVLVEKQAVFKGVDHQIDHYFKVTEGRLKMRKGNIEQALIHYARDNQEGPKASEILLYKSSDLETLKEILMKSLETLVVVDKKREIYYIENVKFHIDQVEGLGNFVEIEAIDENGTIGKAHLLEQCEYYMQLLGISEKDLRSDSYSDMMLRLNAN